MYIISLELTNMISLELSKKLKNAGFPQHDQLDGGDRDHEVNCFIGVEQEAVCRPTLSELINVCEGQMRQLTCESDAYGKLTWWCMDRPGHCYSTHDTPEDAVACFWLELHKK